MSCFSVPPALERRSFAPQLAFRAAMAAHVQFLSLGHGSVSSLPRASNHPSPLSLPLTLTLPQGHTQGHRHETRGPTWQVETDNREPPPRARPGGEYSGERSSIRKGWAPSPWSREGIGQDVERALMETSTSNCEGCGSLSVIRNFQEVYGVGVCTLCRKEPKYKLLTRTEAKAKYLLQDEDLKPLGRIEKPHPNKMYPRPMQLYLHKQVERVAWIKHGGEEGIETAKQKQMDRRIEKSTAKRKSVQKQMQKQKKVKQTIQEQIEQEKEHEHEFGEEAYDEAEDVYRKTCMTCGLKTEYEKL